MEEIVPNVELKIKNKTELKEYKRTLMNEIRKVCICGTLEDVMDSFWVSTKKLEAIFKYRVNEICSKEGNNDR